MNTELNRSFRGWVVALACAGALTGSQAALAQTPVPFFEPFADGSLLIVRAGGPDQHATNNASLMSATAIDEFRITSGKGASAVLTYAQTLYMPTTGADRFVVAGSTGQSGAHLNSTVINDERIFVLTGYDAAVGSSFSPATTTAVPRVIATITQGGVINATTRVPYIDNEYLASAVTFDGTNFFFSSGGGIGGGNLGGIRHTTLGATTKTDLNLTRNFHVINGHNGQLYAAGGPGSATSIYTINTETGAATILPGMGAVPNGFFRDFFFAGDTTLYVAHKGSFVIDKETTTFYGGLHRFDFDGTTWNFVYEIPIDEHPDHIGMVRGLNDLAAEFDAETGRVDVYATTNWGKRLIGITDMLSNTSGSQAAVTTFFTYPFNWDPSNQSSWKGIDLIPASAVVTPTCPADFNGDMVRDVADLFAYINAWLAKTGDADFNDDTTVDVADLFAYINAWLAGC